jgi:hypothetical protein
MGSEEREAVTTMATTLNWQASALASACSPFTYATTARTHVQGLVAAKTVAAKTVAAPTVVGQPAVSVRVRTAPIFGLLPGGTSALKINNSIGADAAAPAAAASAATTLILTVPAVPVAPRNEKVQAMVKGGDARGIPPRGTPV